MQTRTGKSLDELLALVRTSGLQKHGEIVTMLKTTLGMGHGDASTLALVAKQAAGGATSGAGTDAQMDGLYTGPKAALRPIHDALRVAMHALGPYDEAPKKAYVSYRRARQFCTIGPATNTRVEVNFNMKGVPPTHRLEALPEGQMCQYRVRVTDASQVDAELLGWIRQAYDAAG
jgi:predicted transport protein